MGGFGDVFGGEGEDFEGHCKRSGGEQYARVLSCGRRDGCYVLLLEKLRLGYGACAHG